MQVDLEVHVSCRFLLEMKCRVGRVSRDPPISEIHGGSRGARPTLQLHQCAAAERVNQAGEIGDACHSLSDWRESRAAVIFGSCENSAMRCWSTISLRMIGLLCRTVSGY